MKIHLPSGRFSSRSNGHFSPTASMGSANRPRRVSWPQPVKAAARTTVPNKRAGRPMRTPHRAIPAPAATTIGQRLQCSSCDSAAYDPASCTSLCPPFAMATGRYVTPVAEITGTPSGKLNSGGGDGTPHSSEYAPRIPVRRRTAAGAPEQVREHDQLGPAEGEGPDRDEEVDRPPSGAGVVGEDPPRH